MTQMFVGLGRVIQVNDDGTFNRVVADVPNRATGIVANPANGHLFIGPNFGFTTIYDLNPLTGSLGVFVNDNADGLAITSDGSILYAVGRDGHIRGYDTSTETLVFDSGFIPGFPVGVAVSSGSLQDRLFANTASGTLVEVDLHTLAQTVIASGGSRGDFLAVDPYNGTLLVTQSDLIKRLGPAGVARSCQSRVHWFFSGRASSDGWATAGGGSELGLQRWGPSKELRCQMDATPSLMGLWHGV